MENSGKTVCYTCVTGGYDKVVDPVVVPENVDFVCFSDKPVDSKVWKRREMPEGLMDMGPVKAQRVVKICPHRYLPEYQTSVWVDGNVTVNGDVSKFAAKYDLSRYPLYVRVHPSRNCIYRELDAVLAFGKDKSGLARQQVARYRAEGYPEKAGMAETCILLRRHSDRECARLCDAWAVEVMRWSERDQLSFGYVCRKLGFVPGCLSYEFDMRSCPVFGLRRHG